MWRANDFKEVNYDTKLGRSVGGGDMVISVPILYYLRQGIALDVVANIRDIILGTILFAFAWGFFTFFSMLGALPNTKKAKSKTTEMFPFFRYPRYKKIFFLGTKGLMPRIVIVLSFIANIGLILLIIFCVLNIFFNTVAMFLVYRVVALLFWSALILRMVVSGHALSKKI